jgi:kumamolisin
MHPPAGYRRVPTGLSGVTEKANRITGVNPAETFSVSIRVRRRADAPPLPDQEYWARTPVGQRHFLSREEFAARYGAAQEDLDRLASFLRGRGLTIVEMSIGRRTLVVSGTAERMSDAFAVQFGVYKRDEETYRSHDGDAWLPEDIAEVVEAIYGLDNRTILHRCAGTTKPKGAKAVTPPQIAELYNFPAGQATGQTIGIFEMVGIVYTTGGAQIPLNFGFASSDVTTFLTNLGLKDTSPDIAIVSVDGMTNAPSGSATNVSTRDIEVTLDIEVAASVAQGAKIAVYFAPNTVQGYIDALTTAIHDTANAPSVLSISYGAAENISSWTCALITTVSSVFQEAAQLGITVLVASGDDGTNVRVFDGGAHVSYPASDPWVIACGGTYTANVKGSSFTQGTWSDPLGAGGGGLSVCFVPPPSWQAKAKLPPSVITGNPQGRGVPDIAGNASPYSGYDLILYGESTTKLKLTAPAKGVLGVIGGTSAVAPLYAALIALINADLDEPVGYLNPTLYALAETPGQKVFADIDDGASNSWHYNAPVPPKSPPITGTSPGYTSAPGWDACTGWGTVNGLELLSALLAQEETLPINPNNPFNFTYPPPQPGWALGQAGHQGASDSFDDLEAGVPNTADNFGTPHSPYDSQNNGNGDGPDSYGDVTLINTAVGYNATFASDNIYTGEGSIGLYGRSRGANFSIGVMGQSSKGCAVYGLATDENPNTPPNQLSHGIGVVGRSMGGVAPEEVSVEQIMAEPIGVLGHSTNGPGVRGHGGPLLTLTQAGPVTSSVQAQPGGVFSSGQLQDQTIPATNVTQEVSLDSTPQLRLVPSTAGKLPANATIGDFFLAYSPQPVGNDPSGTAQLYLCTHFLGNVPQWQQVQLGGTIAGGTAL